MSDQEESGKVIGEGRFAFNNDPCKVCGKTDVVAASMKIEETYQLVCFECTVKHIQGIKEFLDSLATQLEDEKQPFSKHELQVITFFLRRAELRDEDKYLIGKVDGLITNYE